LKTHKLVAWAFSTTCRKPQRNMNITVVVETNWSNVDEGFDNYTLTSVDPGSSVLVVTVIVCIALYSLIPCTLSLFHRRNVHRPTFTALAKNDREEERLNDEVSSKTGCCQEEDGGVCDDHGKCCSSVEKTLHFDPKLSRRREHEADASGLNDARPLRETLRAVIAHDNEAKRLYGLAFPYLLKSLLTALADNGLLIIVGQTVGTRELTALALVDLIVGHTSEAVGGVHESLITLIGYSRGANNDKLTGEYIQLAVTLYVLFSIPFLYIGSVYMEAILLFFGMDSITAALGKGFAIPYLFARLLRGVASCLRAVLDVFDLAYVSSALIGIGDVLTIGAVLTYTFLWRPSLQAIGVIILVVELVMLIITSGLIAAKKWFRPFYGGLFQRVALTVSRYESEHSLFDRHSVELSQLWNCRM
jgi:MatE